MEHLIEQIRARPVLWNSTLEEYRDNVVKDKAWEEIASLLKEDKKSIRNQWKKLRDCHRQALQRRKTTTGQAAAQIKKWKYEGQMTFLLKTMAHRPSDSNVPLPADDLQIINYEKGEDMATSEDENYLNEEITGEGTTILENEKRHRPTRGVDKVLHIF